MIVLFLSICNASVSLQRQSSVAFAEVRNGKQYVTRSSHHEAKVTQAGSKVDAHEMRREQKREVNAGLVTQQDLLKQAAGTKNEQDAVTTMREAMGYSVQPEGQSEKG
jgi:hypothetical protein